MNGSLHKRAGMRAEFANDVPKRFVIKMRREAALYRIEVASDIELVAWTQGGTKAIAISL